MALSGHFDPISWSEAPKLILVGRPSKIEIFTENFNLTKDPCRGAAGSWPWGHFGSVRPKMASWESISAHMTRNRPKMAILAKIENFEIKLIFENFKIFQFSKNWSFWPILSHFVSKLTLAEPNVLAARAPTSPTQRTICAKFLREISRGGEARNFSVISALRAGKVKSRA